MDSNLAVSILPDNCSLCKSLAINTTSDARLLPAALPEYYSTVLREEEECSPKSHLSPCLSPE